MKIMLFVCSFLLYHEIYDKKHSSCLYVLFHLNEKSPIKTRFSTKNIDMDTRLSTYNDALPHWTTFGYSVWTNKKYHLYW